MTVNNMSSKKEIELELVESNERFQRLVENISAEYCMYSHNNQGELTYVSPSIEEMLGWTPDELRVNYTSLITDHPANQKAIAHTDAGLSGVRQPPYLMQMRHKDGGFRWVEVSEGPVLDASGKVIGIEGIVHDVTDRKMMEEKLLLLATTDGLTNLYNRIHFNELLENEVKRATRYTTPLSILMLDIDNFKKVNDTYGHQAGDAYLVALASLMRDLSRAADTCARYGGEEFIIILPQTTAENAMDFAARLRQKVEELTVQYNNQVIQCTVSIGINSLSLREEKETEELLRGVDSALYAAKERGRNSVVLYSIANSLK